MKKVVSATLAGALAVGMVPAMALADDAVELQAQTTAETIAAGALVLTDGQTAGQVFTYGDPNGTALIPTEIIPQNETDPDNYVAVDKTKTVYVQLGTAALDASWDGYTVDGKQVKGVYKGKTAPTAAGTYAVFACDESGNWCKQGVSFTIAQQAVTGIEFYEVNGVNTLDETFTYKHAAYEFGTGLGQLDLKGANGLAFAGYESFSVVDPATNLAATPLYAGQYKVLVKDTDGNLADLELGLAIDAYDVNNPAVTIADTTDGTVTIQGIPAAISPYYKVVGIDKPISTTSANGYYTATIGLNDAKMQSGTAAQVAGRAASMVGSKSVTFAKVNQVVTPTVEYNGAAWPTNWEIDYSEKGAKAFNADLVSVKIGGVAIEADQYSLSVVEIVNGKEVAATVADLANAGVYKVTAVLDAEALGFQYAGKSAELDLEVTNGDIATAGIAYVFDGSPVTGAADTVVFDGSDYMSKLEIKVTDDKGKAVDASKYTVTIKKVKDAQDKDVLPVNQVVAEVKDAGVYQIIVTSTEYQIAGGSDMITVTVSKAGVEPNIAADYINDLSQSAFFWTGKDIVVPLTYNHDAKAATPEIAVPEGACKITIKKFTDKKGTVAKYAPKAINEPGTYVIDIEDANPADNYQVTKRTGWTVVVEDKNVYSDVASNAWYADEVYAIAKAGIMGGYGNGKFGPNDAAERQDVALMIYRMISAGDLVVDGDDWEFDYILPDIAGAIDLPFSDANGKAYYADAVWFVNKNGIMTGYSNSDEFGVGDAITREQVATTLFRIIEGGFDKPTLLASNLDAYVDGDEVSKYAVEAMEWAVENGIFGVDTAFLNPGDEITRAELAAVFVRFMAL